jgi:hypothetical protein
MILDFLMRLVEELLDSYVVIAPVKRVEGPLRLVEQLVREFVNECAELSLALNCLAKWQAAPRSSYRAQAQSLLDASVEGIADRFSYLELCCIRVEWIE